MPASCKVWETLRPTAPPVSNSVATLNAQCDDVASMKALTELHFNDLNPNHQPPSVISVNEDDGMILAHMISGNTSSDFKINDASG